jgi:hypothetical protein
MSGRKRRVLVLGLGSVLVLGCGSNGSEVHEPPEDAATPPTDAGDVTRSTLNTVFRTAADALGQVIVPVGGGIPPAGIAVDAVYFQHLGITALHYRPGEAVQNHRHHSQQSDWSYQPIVIRGLPESNDLVLRDGDPIDLVALRTDEYWEDYIAEDEYADEVGYFDVDLLHVDMREPGIVYDGEYWGTVHPWVSSNTDAPLWRHPDLNDLPMQYARSIFPGSTWDDVEDLLDMPNQLVVVFARPDWFAEPVLVQVGIASDGITVDRWVEGSSRDLTAQEESVLQDMFDEDMIGMITPLMLFVPMPERVRWDITGAHAGDDDDIVTYRHPEFVVSLDLSAAVDPATDFEFIRDNNQAWEDSFEGEDPDSQPAWNPETYESTLVYLRGDANMVPYGLEMSVRERAVAHDPTGADAGVAADAGM